MDTTLGCSDIGIRKLKFFCEDSIPLTRIILRRNFFSDLSQNYTEIVFNKRYKYFN